MLVWFKEFVSEMMEKILGDKCFSGTGPIYLRK